MCKTPEDREARQNYDLPAEAIAVRNVLQDIQHHLANLGVAPEDRFSVQVVLAEVLNNIVEHACADTGGRIRLEIGCSAAGLTCDVHDDGAEMPGGALRKAMMPRIGKRTDSLPEGGFGRSLIQHLATELVYERRQGQNRLSFQVRFSG